MYKKNHSGSVGSYFAFIKERRYSTGKKWLRTRRLKGAGTSRFSFKNCATCLKRNYKKPYPYKIDDSSRRLLIIDRGETRKTYNSNWWDTLQVWGEVGGGVDPSDTSSFMTATDLRGFITGKTGRNMQPGQGDWKSESYICGSRTCVYRTD